MKKSRRSKPKVRSRKGQINWKAVGRRVREVRGFDLTQDQFAKQIGVTQHYLSTIENGQVRFGTEILLSLSQVSGRSMEWVLTGKE